MVEKGSEPLLFRGQRAEWVTVRKPTDGEIADSWMVRSVLDGTDPILQEGPYEGLLCGGPSCSTLILGGVRALMLTTRRKAGHGSQKIWFCSLECERRNHVEVAVRRRTDPPGPI